MSARELDQSADAATSDDAAFQQTLTTLFNGDYHGRKSQRDPHNSRPARYSLRGNRRTSDGESGHGEIDGRGEPRKADREHRQDRVGLSADDDRCQRTGASDPTWSSATRKLSACGLCSADCGGSFMRPDPRYSRVRTMLTAPEVPRLQAGGIALCHHCQRKAYFAGGFIELLIKQVRVAARFPQQGSAAFAKATGAA